MQRGSTTVCMLSSHGKRGAGSVVRAAAAVQRAAERATLDRNDYSGACISAEAASALSPGAIALVNGTMANSRVELQVQLNGTGRRPSEPWPVGLACFSLSAC